MQDSKSELALPLMVILILSDVLRKYKKNLKKSGQAISSPHILESACKARPTALMADTFNPGDEDLPVSFIKVDPQR
jgi:hypothetical protein